MFHDGDVEPVDFDFSRLRRDFFNDEWKMKPDALDIYSRVYPVDIARILDDGFVLRVDYRDKIGV